MGTSPEEKIGILEFLENHLSFRWKLLGFVLIVAGLVYGLNYVMDLRKQLLTQEAETATLKQQFQAIGSQAIAKNEVVKQPQLDKLGEDSFGSAVIQAMRESQSTLIALSSTVSTLKEKVSSLQTNLPKTFTQSEQATTTGALTGYTLEESRTDNNGKTLPPTSAVNLFYDPKQQDPNLAFKGTTWLHYREIFKPVVGEWQSQKDGSYKTTLALSRTVQKPDPNHPGQMIDLGTEQLPITDGDTIFSPKVFTPKVVIPRWTISLGLSDSKNKYSPVGMVDYRFTNRVGLFAGTANDALIGGVSLRIGNK